MAVKAAVAFFDMDYENGKLGMDEFDKKSSEYEHAKVLFEELKAEGTNKL
ncbi:MAG: hypothetical protein J6X97_03295 [Lachnospiraceae bacterium]|nr:hypothetical protein [Lachnospiraceae bacterium]